MSRARVAIINSELFHTLATQQDEQPCHFEEEEDEERLDHLPASVLDLMIKKGLSTQYNQRLTPATPLTFSSTVIKTLHNQNMRQRTTSDFRVRRKTVDHSSGSNTSISNHIQRATFFRQVPHRYGLDTKVRNKTNQRWQNLQPPQITRINTKYLTEQREDENRRKQDRVNRIFHKKYGSYWQKVNIC